MSARERKARKAPSGAAVEATSLRQQAAALQEALDHMERGDWSGWLRYGAVLAERITDLKCQASRLENDARRAADL